MLPDSTSSRPPRLWYWPSRAMYSACAAAGGAVLDDFITTWTMAKGDEPLRLLLLRRLRLPLLLLLLLAIRLRSKLGIAPWLFHQC